MQIRAACNAHLCRAILTNRNNVYIRNMNDEFLTVAEVAEILDVSPDTVRRMFGQEPGVVNLGRDGAIGARRYRILRIPRAVLNRVIDRRAVTAAVGTTGNAQ
jgi:Helix-turn-helix domain